MVVTKGAGRISEVSARFTLDAMPGKQMAIDADLNAGLITQDEARVRRAEVRAEADFYGSMDGASKFVRGDAIAGILILVINIVGGLAIGTIGHGLASADAAATYTLLTIGDGLVAQIPALLLSTAVGHHRDPHVAARQDMGRRARRGRCSASRARWRAPACSAYGPDSRHAQPRIPVVAALCGGGAYSIRKRRLAAAAKSVSRAPPRRRRRTRSCPG